MSSINHDNLVHNPLGGASYVFEKDLLKWLAKQLYKNTIKISIGAQPNSSPHFGTLTVFALAFALGNLLKNKMGKNPEIIFEVIDTAPAETLIIDGNRYQKSLKTTGISDKYLVQYKELLEVLSYLSSIQYKIRKQSEFNEQAVIPEILHKIVANKADIAKILDPEHEQLRIRVACKTCGLTDKDSNQTTISSIGVDSYCPNHGRFTTTYEESKNFEYNTPLRNLIRALAYAEDNCNKQIGFEWMRITGSDYAGFYQEQLLYKPASILGYNAKDLPIILYSPLITDWSGAKLSKSLYVKHGAYKYLPTYIVDYEHFVSKLVTLE
jgi:predicted Zn-ribbon and HTH transcriptional regulator